MSLKKNLKDKKFIRTFDTAVDNKEIKDNLLLLVNAAKLSQQKPSNAFSLTFSCIMFFSASVLFHVMNLIYREKNTRCFFYTPIPSFKYGFCYCF